MEAVSRHRRIPVIAVSENSAELPLRRNGAATFSPPTFFWATEDQDPTTASATTDLALRDQERAASCRPAGRPRPGVYRASPAVHDPRESEHLQLAERDHACRELR
jgi:hypothetical protein